VPLGSLGKEEHRIEAAGRQTENLLGKVQGEPPQATVDVPQFLEIDDDAGEAVWHGVAMGVSYLRESARQRATRDAGVVVENAARVTVGLSGRVSGGDTEGSCPSFPAGVRR
jgi:hypothetical protein